MEGVWGIITRRFRANMRTKGSLLGVPPKSAWLLLGAREKDVCELGGGALWSVGLSCFGIRGLLAGSR